MGKGKKKRSKSTSAKEDKTIQSKLATWNSLDDIENDSADEFHNQRAKVLLTEETAPAYYQSSGDEGVLELSEESEEEDLDDEDFEREEALVKNLKKYGGEGSEEDEEDDGDEDGEEGWGTSSKAYYDADQDSMDDEMGMLMQVTNCLAKEEEVEALKIQKKRLEEMEDDDFLDDTFAHRIAEGNKEVKTKEVARESTLLESEKLRLLKSRAPELENLLAEFKEKSEEVELLKSLLNNSDSEKSRFNRLRHRMPLSVLTI